MNESKHYSVVVLQYVVVLAAMIVFIFPIFWMIMTSLKNQTDAFTSVPKWTFAVTYENYKIVLFERSFMKYLGNSLYVSLFSTVLAVTLGSGIAYPFARYKLAGAKNVLSWVLTLRIVPPIVSILPIYLVFSKLNMLDTYTALILMYTFMNLPLTTWLLYGFFKDIPGEIEESALVDGCNRFTAFFRVIFPIVGPGLVSAALLSFIFAWNEFLFANILSGPHVRTAPVGLNEYATPVSVLWGQIAAAGTMIIVPIAVITVALQRKMVSGLTMGAVKG
ncbi:carbohydrate ABC transporter permease [Paenibacillus alginolyticus]|uniref:Carbohydrate ABC transporter permease n=1 Tax=Paenibacillus alginolyticus TaxID=59839 RepID=A0ABT4GNW3_9BACL|nr:carbohydrate ABC transporter permease [Paenibacillus alginolyticus]MCY9666745.1 carbohydrate ABC transporter permease [Paenibacillus alginolyticus]MCY9697698.1 carbohydrate ABC transporter permease [Paenibacillus alginolyticus]MEC0146742.1 carbohydrate ABC transporter permease [Paenibacillus alginolyticus]